VLYENGQVAGYADRWNGEEVNSGETPPAGLYSPVRGFGKVWLENAEVRHTLGWATALEQGYTATEQWAVGPDGRLSGVYLTLPGGRVLYIYDSSLWYYANSK
jgi:hypothetical protein